MLLVDYRLWASVRLSHLEDWVRGWVPEPVFSVGNGVSFVKVWFSTAWDVEEVLSDVREDQQVFSRQCDWLAWLASLV